MNHDFYTSDEDTAAYRKRVYEQTGIQILDSLPANFTKDLKFTPLHFVKSK